MPNIAGSWENAEDDAHNARWARECFPATRVFSTGGTYLYFLTDEERRERIVAPTAGRSWVSSPR